MRKYFLKTQRVGFSLWERSDGEFAKLLWGSKEVTNFLSASGTFSEEEIVNRLALETDNFRSYHVQYFPIFELATNKFMGCGGLRPYDTKKIYMKLGFIC